MSGPGGPATLISVTLLACACGDQRAVDATVAPEDALPWGCSISPAPESIGTNPAIAVVFDQAVPLDLQGYFWAYGVFDGAIKLIAARSSHVVDLNGVVVESNGYPAAAGAYDLLDVHRGAGGFGAVMRYQGSESAELRFCVLDQSGRFDEDRCAPMGPDSPQPTRVASTATGYLAFSLRKGGLYEWSFDAVPTLLDEGVIPGPSLSRVIDAVATTAGAVVYTSGWSAVSNCGTVQERRLREPSSVLDLVPPDFSAGVGRSSIAEGDNGESVILLSATCLETSTCVAASDTVVSLLYKYLDGNPTLGPVAIDVPSGISHAVVVDRGKLMVVSETHDERMVISRFDETGVLEFGEVVVALAYSEPGNVLGALVSAFAVGPNDYVVAYTMGGPGGGPRVARFTIAPQ